MPASALLRRRLQKAAGVRGIDRNLVRYAALFGLAFTIAMAATGVEASTCVDERPVKISGIFCGRAFDPTGEPVADVALRLLDAAGSVAAEVHTDSKGDFVFSPLPNAKYRLTTVSPGWVITFGAIEISGGQKTVCRRPVSVTLGLRSCEGGISRKRPLHS
jgi:hypothetical protein